MPNEDADDEAHTLLNILTRTSRDGLLTPLIIPHNPPLQEEFQAPRLRHNRLDLAHFTFFFFGYVLYFADG